MAPYEREDGKRQRKQSDRCEEDEAFGLTGFA